MPKPYFFMALIAILVAIVSTAFWLVLPENSSDDMREAAVAYLEAIYAQDYEKAYDFISSRDRRVKSRAAYTRENPSFPSETRILTSELARLIEIEEVKVDRAGERAKLVLSARFPDANSQELQELFKEFDPDRLAQTSTEERRKMLQLMETMKREGRLPMIAGTETVELVRENGEWRVFVDWADAVKVVFRAEVKEGLPWDFEPVDKVVMAKPGQTLHAAYRARNRAKVSVTAKARHIDAPRGLAQKYLQIIQCFCFLREKLGPGEEKELPLVFRVDLDVPREVDEFVITYQFFPLNKFPKDANDT